MCVCTYYSVPVCLQHWLIGTIKINSYSYRIKSVLAMHIYSVCILHLQIYNE